MSKDNTNNQISTIPREQYIEKAKIKLFNESLILAQD